MLENRSSSYSKFKVVAIVAAAGVLTGCAPGANPLDDKVLQTQSSPAEVTQIPEGSLLQVFYNYAFGTPTTQSTVPKAAPSQAADDKGDANEDINISGLSASTSEAGFETIRVRLFPIKSNHDFDPYLPSSGTRTTKLQNPAGLVVTGLPKQGRIVGKLVQFDFRARAVAIDGKSHVFGLNDEISIAPVNASQPTSVLLRINAVRLRRAKDLGPNGMMAFRGSFKVLHGRGEWALMNDVSLEDYVTSVVPSEMPLSYSDESLMVQALAARTFAVRAMIAARCIAQKQCTERDWDVDPSVGYQSFTGFYAENDRVRNVTNRTAGMVISYNHTPILAMFHANSGGKTRSGADYFCAGKSWREHAACVSDYQTNYPYLAAVVDPYNDGARRLGHGVGLPQHSVEEMTKKNVTVGSIITRYYPGTILERLRSK